MAEQGKEKANAKDRFVIYHNEREHFDVLSDEDAGKLIKAIFSYEVDGTEPKRSDLPGEVYVLFRVLRQRLDESREHYAETCKERAQSGRKGGLETQRRKRAKAEANQANALNDEANEPDIENDIEKDIEDDIEGDIERRKVKGSAPADLNGARPKDSIINRKTFTAQVKKVYNELGGSAYSLEDCLYVFNYFLDSYEKARGEAHPGISNKSIRRYISDMPGITDEHEDYKDIDPEDYPAMIDSYFNTQFNEKCDYHMEHFFNGNIRMIRYYETVFNE